ncbi:MAG: AAA family ATPase [Marinobacter sp.]|uniref:bifunctional aminoglycoside phosphotransferase/ATP-binding protein n=1 Tax=Marinobacter sp. TaxID=50741 RepID=UPI0034A048C6
MSETPIGDLILALQNPSLYDHTVTNFQVHETHISWVILTGTYAYKIKKPLDFGFLDFSTLDRRKRFCEEELRLNSRLAGELYLDVVPITGTPEQPELNGNGEPFEYAVRMRQFDQRNQLDIQQEAGKLRPDILKSLARQVAQNHHQLPRVPDDKPFGTPDAVFAAMQENFDQIRPLLSDAALLEQVDRLEAWTRTTFDLMKDRIARRRDEGFVRECHGDLHLANITVYENEVTVFDCIEFSEPFRWIDVINDFAFLLMDLEARRESTLANQTLNTYLEFSGDFDGLPLLPLYKAYRAMVRAKISLFMMGNPSLSEAEKTGLTQRYQDYANLAESYSNIPNRFMMATTGLSGSGKSVVSAALSAQLGLVRLRSDVERKRLFGLSPLDNSKSGPKENLYTEQANRETYELLAKRSAQLLAAGLPVIVDAANLKQHEREQLETVAENQGVPFALIDCEAPEALRRQWVRARKDDASEADEALLEQQTHWLEPLSDREKTHTIHVHAEQDHVAEALADRIRQHFGLPGA